MRELNARRVAAPSPVVHPFLPPQLSAHLVRVLHVVLRLEGLRVVEPRGVQEVQQRPELLERVLQRRTRHQKDALERPGRQLLRTEGGVRRVYVCACVGAFLKTRNARVMYTRSGLVCGWGGLEGRALLAPRE